MELIITRVISNLLLPPGINILIIILGLILLRRFYRTGMFLIFSSFLSFVILCLPITAYFLNYPNYNIKPISELQLKNTDLKAIVILSGGSYRKAPEYHQDTVSTATLARIRYGAYLHRKTKIPLLVTGGVVYGEGQSEAELMQQSLQEDFNVTVKWIENKSRNTQENAIMSFNLLEQDKIKNIILVTDFSHIKRSQTIFEKVGFNVTPAPLNFKTDFENTPLIISLVPSSEGLFRTKAVLREYMGQLWYSIRY